MRRSVGAFLVDPADTAVEAGAVLLLAFTWTHPTGWRDLATLQLRIIEADDPEPERILLWVLWDQESNTFSLRDRKGRFGRAALPGSPHTLQSPRATLHLDDTHVLTSGPEGHDVTLLLALTFKPKAGGHDHRDYVVEVFATDDLGQAQGFDPAGTLRVDRHPPGPGL